MSTHLESIAQWIECRGIGFTIGTNLFVGFIPPKRVSGADPPQRCVVLLENAGGVTYPDLEDRVDKAVQVRARAKKFSEAETDSLTIYSALHVMHGQNLPEWETCSGNVEYVAMEIEANSPPAPVGYDEDGRHVFSTNYIVRIRDRK